MSAMSTDIAPVVRLIIRAPTADSPGYLRRQRRAMALMRKFNALEREAKAPGDAAEMAARALRFEQAIDDIVAFALDYVVEPADRSQAAEALLDLSQTRLLALLGQLRDGVAPPLAPPSAPASGGGSSAG